MSTIQGPDMMAILGHDDRTEPHVFTEYSSAHDEPAVYVRIPQHVSLEHAASILKTIAKHLPQLSKQFQAERQLRIDSMQRVANEMLERLPAEMSGMSRRESGEVLTAFESLARQRARAAGEFDNDIPF